MTYFKTGNFYLLTPFSRFTQLPPCLLLLFISLLSVSMNLFMFGFVCFVFYILLLFSH